MRVLSTILGWLLLLLKAWNIALALSDLCGWMCFSMYGSVGRPSASLLCQAPLPRRVWSTFKYQEAQPVQHGRYLRDIMAVIERMHDHLGVDIGAGRDLTLHGATAHIVPELTTPPKPSSGWPYYRHDFPEYDQHSPLNIFEDPPVVGECWRFPGRQGFAGIHLEEPTNVTAVSIVYPLHEQLSTAMVLEAPRLIRVWVVPYDEGRFHQASCLNRRRPLSDFAGSRVLKQPLTEKSVALLLKEFQYDIHQSRVRQIFHTGDSACNAGQVSIVIVEIAENWGANATCVYHVGVHGVV